MVETEYTKSKMEYFLETKQNWTPGIAAKYMNELTRKQTSLIYKARTRMLKVKGNYKNGYPDLKCRFCKKVEENQKHILEDCMVLHQNQAISVPAHLLFSEDTDTLREISKKLEKIIEKLDETAC